MKKTLTAILAVCAASALFAREKWTPAQAASWYAAEPFRAGANFIPSNAINQIEMWSSDTFSPDVIDRELGWAESIGFNHKHSNRLVAHVSFADGHVEKLVAPSTFDSSKAEELTKWLCTGILTTFDGNRYSEAKE